ncbi:hypothetical protein M758_3G024700 [Ceratodon purpureus]|nr:hypothetical protein M758_3G024700 [Ceratodon purpureus]
MLSQVGCAEEDAEVDPQLGYPPVYARLCRHADAAGLPMPFTEGPPQRFLPYAPHEEDLQHLKDWDSLFPVVAERERDSSNTRKFAEDLWQQLDHLGNAGFDPSKFRVDPYGNVVYWNADPSSPLAWDIDHWFPSSRGGRTKLPNLRIVQWQAYLRKRNRLEFLVPWWDLQHGCSINQFLSAFAAKNADFRKRSFALFFEGGEDESVAREHVGECRPWPQHFREKKALSGLAAAAIISVPKNNAEGEVRVGLHSTKGSPPKRHWSAEEEEAVRRGVSKFGPGSWKEIKEDDSALANRSAVQIKEKFRLMRGVARNHGTSSTGTGRNDLLGRQSAATTALQKELRVKIMREEERRKREEELAQLEETVLKLKLENEKERIKALELETMVKKRKHRVEKQRKLAESQSSYRLCLERVLRDTMHQTMSYKEQARLTQEACNVLIARLDCQKATCEATEIDLLQRHSKREALEAAGAGSTTLMHKKIVTKGRDIVDVSSCVSLHDEEDEEKILRGNVLSESDTEDEGDDEVYSLRREHQQANARKSLVRHAIKVAMQVGDTKEAVDMSTWEVPPVDSRPSCLLSTAENNPASRTRIRKSEEIASIPHHQYDAHSETAESASDSDFADDEMSPAIRISKDGSCQDDSNLVNELSKFHDGPTSALRDFCTWNSKPGDSDYAFDHGQALIAEPALDTPIPSAGETSRSDSKREVQKDVIMVQTESSSKYESMDTAALYKQEYLDELLQQIRFQIPTAEVKGTGIADNSYTKISEGHLDELLEQVLTTHLDNMRRNEARDHQSADTDDERLRQIGKSNLDKWLQALLFKDVVSAASSPGRDTPLPLHSPALSQISVAAMRESLELARHQEFVTRDGENADRPKSLWGALLRKLSVRHQYEHERMLFMSLENGQEAEIHDADITDSKKFLSKKSPNIELTMKQNNAIIAEGRRSSDEPYAVLPGSNFGMSTDPPAVWKTERRVEDGLPAHTLDFAFSEKRHNFPRPLSDVDEASETESGDNPNRASGFADTSKPRKSVSGKVAGFVGWKKSSKRVDSRSQDELASSQLD